MPPVGTIALLKNLCFSLCFFNFIIKKSIIWKLVLRAHIVLLITAGYNINAKIILIATN